MKKLLVIGFLILMGFSFSSGVLGAQNQPWQLRVQKDGICVYTRKVDGSAILEFKSDVVVSAPLDKVIALFEDEKRAPRWYYECQRMDLVEDEGPYQKIFYSVLHLPWPVAQRDSVFRRTKFLDTATGGVTYKLTALPQRLPLQKGNVRVSYLKAVWRFTPLNDTQTKIYFRQHSDAGGSIPSFMTNALVVDIPFNSLKDFRKLVQK